MVETTSAERPLRKSSPIRRFVKRWRMAILLGLVLVGAGYEWYNKWTYDKSRLAIQRQLAVQRGKSPVIRLADIEPFIYGLPFRRTGRERGNNVLNLSWCGLFTAYPLQIQQDDQGVVLGVYEIAPAAIHDAEGPAGQMPPQPAAIVRAQPGLPASARNVVCVSDAIEGKGIPVETLLSELPRQALLIAARDEMGLVTRDSSLREQIPSEPNATSWPLATRIALNTGSQRKSLCSLSLVELDPRSLRQVFITEMPDQGASLTVDRLTTFAERLSRTDFVKVLETKGFQRQRLPGETQDDISEAISKQLTDLNCLPQFAAVRALHGEIRTSGESPARLGNLAQAYATLGSLSEHHWTVAHKTFKARGLLYAERLMAKHPGPGSHRMRAYVRALVGLHQAALTDLQAAKKLSNGEDRNPERTATLLAFCEGRYAQLGKDVQQPEVRKLARYLRYLAMELVPPASAERQAADELLEAAPRCLRVVFPPPDRADPWNFGQALDNGRNWLRESLHDDLPSVPGLPDDVLKLRNKAFSTKSEHAAQVQVLQALTDSGKIGKDAQEPSLGALSELIRDLYFVQGTKELAFLPEEAYVFTLPKGARTRTPRDSLDRRMKLDLCELVAGHPYINKVDRFIEVTSQPLSRTDPVFRDYLLTAARFGDPPSKRQLARQMFEVCPQTPACLAFLVANDWDFASKHARDWEAKYSDAPILMREIAQQYFTRRQWAEAEACLNRSIKESRDQASYHLLGDLYNETGDDDKFEKTWEEALTVPGTEQQRLNAEFALSNYYRRVKNPTKACLHVEELLQIGSVTNTHWGLFLAADCHEEAGQWEQAHEYRRRAATLQVYNGQTRQFDNRIMEWYLWCRRTGRGDAAAARELLRLRLAPLESSNAPTERARAAVYYYCEEDFRTALELFRWAFNADQDPYWGIQAALIADELGEVDLRDTLLSDTLNAAVRRDHSLVDVIHDLRNALATPAIPINLLVAEWRLRVLSGGQPTNHWYYLGKFLSLRGNQEDGQRLLKLAAGSPANDLHATTMAGASLVRDGVNSQPVRALELDDEQPRISHLVQKAYDHLKKKEYDTAREFVDRALQRRPASLNALYVRGRIAEDSKLYASAIADYSTCLQGIPESVDLLCRRGSCREQIGDYQAAIQDYERAMGLDPNYGTPQLELAAIRASCPDPNQLDAAQAMKLAKAAYTVDRLPGWKRDHVLGMACAASEDFDLAVKHSLEAVKRSPPEARGLTQNCLDLYRQGKVYIQKLEK